MSYGLEVFNTTGNVQINSQFINLALRSKITMNSTTSTNHQWFDLALSDVASPVVAVDSTANLGLGYMSRNSGGTYFFNYLSPGLTQRTATFYVFDKIPTTPSNWGLQVFDQSDNLVFDANEKYMRVIDQYQGSNFLSGFESTSLPGRKIIPAFLVPSTAPIGLSQFAVNGADISLGSVTRTSTFLSPSYQPQEENRSYAMLIIDVTNY